MSAEGTTRRSTRGAGRLGASDPASWEADVVLRDGTVAHVRPIRPDDKAAIQTFHAGQSPESIYLRFFAAVKVLSDADLVRYTEVDQVERVALVVTSRDAIIGIGRYDTVRPGTAEVAFNIADAHQGKGIGSVLLEHLAAIAQELGVERFVADVLPQNRAMINVFRDAGYEVTHHFEDGVVALAFDIAPTERSEQVRRSREHRAEALSVARVLRPASLVVVGASNREDSAGRVVLQNILDGGYTGAVHVVHPSADEVCGLPVARSVRDVGTVDLAVVVVPAAAALDVVDDCAAAGVGAVLVMSGGFAESGERDLQLELRARAHAAGMRVVGPHSYGVATTDEAVRLAATPAAPPLPGHLGLFVQSGAVGVACLGSARRRGVGLSYFLSAGNRVDISGNDVMQYALDDADTTVLGLHLESIGNPRKFSRIAREVGRVKPVVVVKAGQSGTAVPPGQTVRTAPVPAGAFEAMLRQAGVIEVATVHQLLDVAQLLVTQPLPAGPRVRVIGNTGALEALTANVAVAQGLSLAGEPVALGLGAGSDDVERAVREAVDDDGCDAVVVCYEPPPVGVSDDVRGAVARAAAGSDKPVLATLLGIRGLRDDLTHEGRTVPAFSMPEDAVIALAAAHRYAGWRDTDLGSHRTPDGIDRTAAFTVIDTVLADGERDLTDAESRSVAAAYGIDLGEPAVPVGASPGQGMPVVVTTQENPLFGPLVGFALDGPVTSLLHDIGYAVPPLTDRDVEALLRSVRTFPLVERVDPSGGGREALAAVVARVAELADDFPELARFEVRVVVSDGAAVVESVDGAVARPQVRTDADRRAMTS